MMPSAIGAFGDEIALDLEEQIANLEKQEVRVLEVRAAWGTNVLDLEPDQLNRAARLLDAAGIRVSAIASPVGKTAIDADFDAELVRLRVAFDAAKRLGTKLVRVFSFFVPQGSHQAHRDEALSRMSALAREAAAQDLVLVHENERYIYGDDAERCLDLIESVGSPSLRVAFDPANFVQVGIRPFDEAWPLLAKHVVHFHVKDAVAADGSVRPAGEGDGQLPELLRALDQRRHSGYLVIEPHLMLLMPDVDATERFAVAVNALRRLLRGIESEVSISSEPFDSEDAKRLVARLDEGLAGVYPPEQRFGPNLKPEHLEGGRGTFLVARAAGMAIGCGAIRLLDPTTAEVKRMYVDPERRGRGVGRAVLARLEGVAREYGVRRLVLETGVHQDEANSLYRSAGFVPIDCWGEYASSPTSVCFEKKL